MTRRRQAGTAMAVALLLALHFAMAVGSKRRESTTSDELVHLTAGFTYWKFNDYRLQPENGNLPQRWVALPTWIAGAKFPDRDQVYWRQSEAWVLAGHEFFYETGEDHFPRLMAARAMAALFSAGCTGALVFCLVAPAVRHARRLRFPPLLLRLQPNLPRPRRPRHLRRLHRPLHAGLDRRLVAPPGRRPGSAPSRSAPPRSPWRASPSSRPSFSCR